MGGWAKSRYILQELFIFLLVIFSTQIIRINSPIVKGNNLKHYLYIYIIYSRWLFVCLSLRIDYVLPLHTNNLIIRVIKHTTHQIWITVFSNWIEFWREKRDELSIVVHVDAVYSFVFF